MTEADRTIPSMSASRAGRIMRPRLTPADIDVRNVADQPGAPSSSPSLALEIARATPALCLALGESSLRHRFEIVDISAIAIPQRQPIQHLRPGPAKASL